MAQNLTNFDNVLKTVYLGPIREQLNNVNYFHNRIKKESTQLPGGKEAYVPLHTDRNQGIGARADGGALPTAGQQGYESATFTMKYNYGRIQVTGPTISASKSDKGSFTRAVTSEIKGMVRDLKRDFQRQLFGDGTGSLATVAAAFTNDTFQVADARFIAKGMTIDFYTGASALDESLYVSSVSGTTVTLSSTATVTDASYIVRAGNYNKEITGLSLAVSTGGTFGNINRATAGNEFWKSQSDTNSGTDRELTLEIMEDMIDEIDKQAATRPSVILTTHKTYRKYGALMLSDRRFRGDAKKLDGGYSALDFEGIMVAPDRDCQAGTMYFLDEDTFTLYEMSNWDWMDKDGAILSRVSGYDAYEAVLCYYSNLGCDMCKANGIITDIEED